MFNTSTYYNYGNRDYWELSIQINSPGETYDLNIQGTSPKISITWGDGSSTYVTTAGDVSHTYASAGTYSVKVSGSFTTNGNIQQSQDNPTGYKVVGTSRMRGLRGITSMERTFAGCTSLPNIPAGLFDDHPNVTSFESTFSGCYDISGSIPSGLFNNNPLVTTFYDTFGNCDSITNIPPNLFDNNPLVTEFSFTFNGCYDIASIPPNLFDFNPLVTRFQGTFSNLGNFVTSIPPNLFDFNPLVTDFVQTFNGCFSLTSIPTGLFNLHPLVTDFSATFQGCSALTSIPVGLFNNNPSVTSFLSTFRNCTSLASIPVGLFNNNTLATSFFRTFQNCTNLTGSTTIFSTTANPNRFLNQSVNFQDCFSLNNPFTGTQGTAPALWTYNFGSGTSIKTDCWQGHSAASLTNYASIPLAWR